MTATFQILPAGPWLLDEVHSTFRGSDHGSTGTVSIPDVSAELLQSPAALLKRVQATQDILAAVEAAPEGARSLRQVAVGADVPFVFRPTWTADARKATPGRRDEEKTPPALIGIHRVETAHHPEGGVRITLQGIARCEWKAYRTSWTARVHTSSGETASAMVEMDVRSEGAPSAFAVVLELPEVPAAQSLAKLYIEGLVQAVRGMYHGHGMWMTLQR